MLFLLSFPVLHKRPGMLREVEYFIGGRPLIALASIESKATGAAVIHGKFVLRLAGHVEPVVKNF